MTADPQEPPQPPGIGESVRQSYSAFSRWGYERHTRWGGSTLTSPNGWSVALALTVAALLLFVIGLERHADLWRWLSVHRQFFFVVQSIGALGLGALCLWHLAYRPPSLNSARLAAAFTALVLVVGLALLCDRANDALMTAGGTLLLMLGWRLAAMHKWWPRIVRDLIALSGRIERPSVPQQAGQRDPAINPIPSSPGP